MEEFIHTFFVGSLEEFLNTVAEGIPKEIREGILGEILVEFL